MPFGFILDLAFGFAGIPTLLQHFGNRQPCSFADLPQRSFRFVVESHGSCRHAFAVLLAVLHRGRPVKIKAGLDSE